MAASGPPELKDDMTLSRQFFRSTAVGLVERRPLYASSGSMPFDMQMARENAPKAPIAGAPLTRRLLMLSRNSLSPNSSRTHSRDGRAV